MPSYLLVPDVFVCLPLLVPLSCWHRLGFHLYDLLELHYQTNTGMLIQVDLLFVHETSPLWHPTTTGFPKPTWHTPAAAR